MLIVIYLLILILVVYLLVRNMKEPQCLVDTKKKYAILRNYIKTNKNVPKKFKVLKKQILISGYKKTTGALGWNSNKGDEIGLCIDGSSNQTFHILLHELSHSTLKEYSHSEEFWNNFKELRNLCEKIKIYTPIDHQEKFCGKFIKD